MVRTLPHPHPLSAIDAKRIAANVAVVVVHGLALALLMLPSRMEPPAPDTTTRPPTEIVFREPPPPVPPTPPPPPVQVQVVRPVPPTMHTPIVRPELPPVDTAPVFEQGEIAAPVVEDAGPPAMSFDPGPQVETLAYLANPAPRYPRPSLRAGDEGRVLLKVLVDAQGLPQSVEIERSSGHRELDRAAREQVLAHWRFHPAVRDGIAVPAYALVPIDFALP